MSKLKTLLKAIQATSDAIEILQGQGVNVDKIVGISNAQGPHARILQSVISDLASELAKVQQDKSVEIPLSGVPPRSLSPASKRKRKSPVLRGK